MGNTRDLFKKIRDQGSISCKDGHNKGQKWYEPNRTRRQKGDNTQNYTKNKHNDLDNYNDHSPRDRHPEMQSHMGLRKHHYEQRRGDSIPAEIFKILKDDPVIVLHSICQQIWKTQQWPQNWKRSVFIQVSKKDNAKECLHHCTIALISRASEAMLKILQAGLQQYMNQELPNEQLGLEKAEEADIKLPTSVGS